MKLIKNLVINVVISGVLLYLLSGMNGQYDNIGIKIILPESLGNSIFAVIGAFLALGLIFWIFNSPIKRILKTLACPINFLTLGLVSIVINVLVIYMFKYVVNTYSGEEIVMLGQIWQTLILSVIMSVGFTILKKIL